MRLTRPTQRGTGMTSQRTRDRLIRHLEAEGISDTRVLEAMRQVPRHIFVDEALASRAYENTALPIGNGQTISQPFVVARMTEALLESGPLQRVLEVGVGSGYQTAILAHVAAQVYGVERIGSLVFQARERLHQLGLHNARLLHGDGMGGWPQWAPYDGILVAAAPSSVPAPLLEQLAPGATLIIPVGEASDQRLIRVRHINDGFEREELARVSFVPLVPGSA
ncbi:MAG: protein-L-isoaspartate(D-aspartate) O-methyltransferase [Gammaproteobacteria bacterium]